MRLKSIFGHPDIEFSSDPKAAQSPKSSLFKKYAFKMIKFDHVRLK